MRFRNIEPPYVPNGFGAVLKWAVVDRLTGARRPAPAHAEVPVRAPDRALLATSTPSLTWVGHATWSIRLCGRSIVTDPNWSQRLGPGVERNVAPGLGLEEARPDVVLVSHNHRDHLDAPSIDRIDRGAHVFVPEGLGPFFTRRGFREVHEMSWWQTLPLGELEVSFVPSQHWSQRGPFDRNETLWGGFVVRGQGRSVYFAGDTAYFGGFQEIGRRFPGLSAALLPIGAYEPEWFMRRQHMNPEDAVRAFLDLGAQLLCAMHWGTFRLTDEPLTEPPQKLEEARRDRGLAAERVWVAAIGESRAL